MPKELRRTTVPPQVRDWVTRETGATVVKATRLAGASSTAIHRLTLSDGRRLVLRRYSWPGYVAAEPIAPRREVDALRFAFSRGLPVPEVVAADETGARVGDRIPVLLMSFLPGRAVAVPDLARLAAVAATIHDIAPDGLGHDYFPWYEGTMTGPPAPSEWPALWETAIQLWRDAMPAYEPTLIHRDFHPGNVLWRRGIVSGIVDWPNGCRGPWGCDIAHCRAKPHLALGTRCGRRVPRRVRSAHRSHLRLLLGAGLDHGARTVALDTEATVGNRALPRTRRRRDRDGAAPPVIS